MDQRIFSISNAIVNNNLNEGAIEFAYQGPLLQLKNGSVNFVITGNVVFNILRKNSIIEEVKCFQNYFLENEDQIDIISTKNSNTLEELLRTIQSWPGVIRTETQIILSSYKTGTTIPIPEEK